jgi:hypothetical protein
MKKTEELVELNKQIEEKYNEIDNLRCEIERIEKENLKEIVKERKQTLVGKTFRRNVYYNKLHDIIKVNKILKNGNLLVKRLICEEYPDGNVDLHIYTNQELTYDSDYTEVDRTHFNERMEDAKTIIDQIYDELC